MAQARPNHIKPRFYLAFEGNTRTQFNSRNYFDNIGRGPNRSKKWGGGAIIGYQFLSTESFHIPTEFSIEGGARRLYYKTAGEIDRRPIDIKLIGARINTMMWPFFPVTLFAGFSESQVKELTPKSFEGPYYGGGIDLIWFGKSFATYFVITNYILKHKNLTDKHLSSYDFGMRFYF